MQSGLRRWVLPSSLLLASTVASGLAGEGLARLALNPVDYLAVDPVFDPVLRVRLEPNAGGHDSWGFRNRSVPDRADIVTIGDSQTYGISAPAHSSWPAQLARLTGRQVYNMALGGYGPVQYHELLRTRALGLQPHVIVVGLYYGNDVWDTYATVYGLRHWAASRRRGVPTVNDSTGVPTPRHVLLAPVRDWLARHSVLYRLTTFTVLGGFARNLEFTQRVPRDGVVAFKNPVHGARTGLTPEMRLGALDLRDPRVREGLRISLDQLDLMAAECRAAGVHLVVALIPTKERVHAPWLSQRADSPEYPAFQLLFEQEHEVDRQVRERLEKLGVRYVDLEAPLRQAAATDAIYPENDDGHPNSKGYAVIAHAVARALHSLP